MEADNVQRVLTAFKYKPRLCMHALAELTGLSKKILNVIVIFLQKNGTIVKAGETNDDRVYRLVDSEAQEAFNSSILRIPELFGLEEEVARSRVLMLKRFRDRLHNDLHPIVSIIIADYERGLRAVEAVREGGEDADALLKELGIR